MATGTAPAAWAACSQPVRPGGALAPDYGQDPLIDRLGLRRAWELSTGRGVTVAVVDSGVDARHPKLAGAVGRRSTSGRRCSSPAGFETGPGTGEDCENHGTPIAGLIAGRAAGDERVLGVAPDALIAPVRFDGALEQAPAAMIADAIRAGAERGRVLNLSFAVPVDNPLIRAAVQDALARDVVVVAAAGNERREQPGLTWYPAAYDGVLAVASVDAAGQPAEDSNRGPWVDVGAPGVDLVSLSAGGERVRLGERHQLRHRRRVRGRGAGPGPVPRADRAGGGGPDRGQRAVPDRRPGRAHRRRHRRRLPRAHRRGPGRPPRSRPPAPAPAIRVLPVPQQPPLLSGTGVTATVAMGILLAAAAVAAVFGLAGRRIAARRRGAHRGRPRPVDPIPEDHCSAHPEHRLA